MKYKHGKKFIFVDVEKITYTLYHNYVNSINNGVNGIEPYKDFLKFYEENYNSSVIVKIIGNLHIRNGIQYVDIEYNKKTHPNSIYLEFVKHFAKPLTKIEIPNELFEI